MNDKKDEFWKELLGEDPFEPDGKPDQKDSGGENETPGFTIEYLNSEGDVLGTSEKLGGRIEGANTPHEPPAGEKKAETVKENAPAEHIREVPKPQNRAEEKPAVNPEKPREQQKKAPKPVPAQPAKPKESSAFSPEKQKKDDFEVDFDFDSEYDDVNEKAIRRGRSKRTGCLSGILYFLFIICISVILACLAWMAATDVLALGKDKESITVTVPKEIFTDETRETTNSDGETEEETVSVADIDYITDMLYDNGLIKYKWLFKLYSRVSNADEKIKAGVYVLSTDYDYRALVTGMNPSAGERVEVDVTIPEGYNTYQIVQFLDSEGVCDEADLWDALANYDFDYSFLDKSTLGDKLRLEGYLFPDTYTFYLGDTASRVINKFLRNFNNKWTDEMQAKADALGYTQYEVITIASMIEKEAGGDADRAKIASVIYNRLRDGGAGTNGYLQIDATIYYAIAGTSDEFSTDYDSPYNTYKYPGLTPGPIANPGLASIEAALEPDDTNYYYYALGKDRLHRFFKTFEEQQAFVNSDEYGG